MQPRISRTKRARYAIRHVFAILRNGIIDGSPPWLKRVLGKPATYLDMLLVDHGIFRILYLNRHKLSPEAWRSAQPAPHQIRAFARSGIKTIVNLRGERQCGSYWLEREACERYGLRLVNFQIGSRQAPSPDELARARELFETVEYPIVMHCKSGADRAGLMSVLYRVLRKDESVERALAELSLKYGHFKQADTGVLDYYFERYLADNQRQPKSFSEWAEAGYDPAEIKRTFHASGWANRLVNGVLRRE